MANYVSFKREYGVDRKVSLMLKFNLMALIIAVTWQSASAQTYDRMSNADIVGSDLLGSDLKGVSEDQCAALCTEMEDCSAYSWIAGKQWCWPKSGNVRTIDSPGVFSGVYSPITEPTQSEPTKVEEDSKSYNSPSFDDFEALYITCFDPNGNINFRVDGEKIYASTPHFSNSWDLNDERISRHETKNQYIVPFFSEVFLDFDTVRAISTFGDKQTNLSCWR